MSFRQRNLLPIGILLPIFSILLGILFIFRAESNIQGVDIIFWSVLIFLSITAQSETSDMTLSQVDVVAISMMFVFPPWMVALLVLIFSINPRMFNPKSNYSWLVEIFNHLIYGISTAITGIAYIIIHESFTQESLGGIAVSLFLMLVFYISNMLTIILLFRIRNQTPLYKLLRDNAYGFPLYNFLTAPIALLIAIIYQNPIFGDWGGWSVIFFLGPIFYAQYLIASRTYQLRRTNQQLIDNEASHQAMIEHLPVGVYRTTETGRFINANHHLVQILGFASRDELLRVNAANFYLTPSERQGEIELRTEAKGTYSNELRFKRKNGGVFWVRDTSTITYDNKGNIIYIDGVIEDITKRKEMESRLDSTHQLILQAKQEWEATVDSLPQFICLLDHNQQIIRSNRGLENWGLGEVYTVQGKQICDVLQDFTHIENEELKATFNTGWNRLELGERFSFEVKNPQTHQYATVEVQPVSPATHHNALGRNSYAVVIVSDNTANKNLEQALRQINLDLETRVQERTAQLEAVNLLLHREINERELIAIELEEALRQEKELSAFKSRFSTMISHEFRTPLAVIQTSADLLERYADRISSEKRVEFIHRIRRQIRHLVNLLDDILTVSRAQTVGIESAKEWTPMEPFVDDIKKELAQLVHTEHKLITYSQFLECKEAYIDARLIRQLIANLVSNAVKYSNEGTTITFNAYCNHEQFIIEVQDEGIGIPQEAYHHLFDVFYRADNVGVIGGTGIGLAIVKLAADLHNGNVTFESEPQKGTKFIVKIPLLKREAS